jgi:hypothetical protein
VSRPTTYGASYTGRERLTVDAFRLGRTRDGLIIHSVYYQRLIEYTHVPQSARQRGGKGGATDSNNPDSLNPPNPLTTNEIRHLFATLILAIRHTTDHILAWHELRLRCCRRARRSHYRKRLERHGRYEPPWQY